MSMEYKQHRHQIHFSTVFSLSYYLVLNKFYVNLSDIRQWHGGGATKK